MTPEQVDTENNDILEFLKQEEGYRQHPYKCTAGANTIGFGRNLDAKGIVREEAEGLLWNDMVDASGDAQDLCVKYRVLWAKLSPGQRKALTAMAFQLGRGGLDSFRKMWAALAARDAHGASQEALNSRWARQTPDRARRTAALIGDRTYA